MSQKNRPCPRCREQGRDRTGNHLFLSRNGRTWLCTRCGHTEHNDSNGSVSEGHTDVDPTRAHTLHHGQRGNMTFKKHEYPTLAISDRKIRKETCEFFGVMTSCSETTGEPEAHYYPVTKKGELTAYKVRKLPKQFFTEGDMKGAVDLFGRSVIPVSGKKLLIVGGELDCLAAWQMLKDKYPQYTPAVVSLPKGENPSSVADNLDLIKAFEEVIVYTDMDKVGRDCADAIAKLVGPRAKIMSTSEKDACDMLKAGKQQEFINAYFSAQPRRPEGIITGSEIKLEDIKQVSTLGYDTQYPDLNRKLGGLRKGELTTLTAGSGVGKSTLAKEIAYHLRAEHDLTVGCIFLEETLQKTVQSFIAIDNNISLAKLRKNPYLLTEEQWQASYDKLIKEKWFALSHFGSLPTEDLLDKMRHLVYGEGCDFVILDHLSMVFSGQSNDNERLAIDRAMTELASFCNESGAGVIVVVHLSRNKSKGSFNEGAQISLNDLRGSAALEQLSWNVIGIERNQQDEHSNIATIRILKSRENGWTGVADTCEYSFETGRLLPVEQNGDY